MLKSIMLFLKFFQLFFFFFFLLCPVLLMGLYPCICLLLFKALICMSTNKWVQALKGVNSRVPLFYVIRLRRALNQWMNIFFIWLHWHSLLFIVSMALSSLKSERQRYLIHSIFIIIGIQNTFDTASTCIMSVLR